ncbi:tubulin binding cofactor C domain-containing protein [Ditylenchus destructor]|nr:tubulin binding cofactor C domain-containing protein [Ditylenchus destructor]
MVFTFKNKPVNTTSNHSENTSKETDNAANTSISKSLTEAYGTEIKDRNNTKENIRAAGEPTLLVDNIHNSIICFQFVTKTVHIQNVHNSTLIFLPTTTSILLRNCGKVRLVVAAQQLRAHDSEKLQFYVHYNTAVVIEGCKEIAIGPYRLKDIKNYSTTMEQYFDDKTRNECAEIQDFECLAGQSPNWSVMDKSKWQEFSLDCEDETNSLKEKE